MITQTQILASRPWLQDLKNGKGCDIVIGPDADGWMSGLYLTNMGATVRGFYNNRQLVVSSDCDRNELKYIDVDIKLPSVVSVGHHITSYSKKNSVASSYHPQGIHINDMYSVVVKDKDPKKSFSYKYPLNTTLWFLWLFEYDIASFTDAQKDYILQADGVSNNNWNYGHSVRHWIYTAFPSLEEMFIFKTHNLLDHSKYLCEYRELRKQHIETQADGQGKGIEKVKVLAADDKGNFTLNQLGYLKALGESIGFPFIEERWKCWSNMNTHSFWSRHFKRCTVTFSQRIIHSPKSISLVFSNTAGEYDFTWTTPPRINAAFGIDKPPRRVISYSLLSLHSGEN